MVADAEKAGQLQAGGTIVEPTSGNTGVGLALVAQLKGYRCVFVCPDKVSEDKQNVLRAYGAEVVVCPTAVAPEDPRSYYSVSDRLAGEVAGAWKPDQYSNPNNPLSHYETTGPEIWAQTEGRVTHFVAGVGTGGTISGAGRYLKEVSAGRVKVIGADPEGSVYSGGSGRPYLVEGVGEDFWPVTYDRTICDEIIEVSDKESFELTRRLAREEGLLVGGSCGMAVVAALRVAQAAGPDDVLASKPPSMPDLVHLHPSETVRDAIDYMREYGVSQLPVLKAEPPVVTGEIAGSIAERDLLDALFSGQAHLHDMVERHMGPPLPLVGGGQPVSEAVALLEKCDGVVVLIDGKPRGVLTRQDLLTHMGWR